VGLLVTLVTLVALVATLLQVLPVVMMQMMQMMQMNATIHLCPPPLKTHHLRCLPRCGGTCSGYAVRCCGGGTRGWL
jgi:hypothetical protein